MSTSIAPFSFKSPCTAIDSAIAKPDTEKELKLVTPNGSSEPFRLFAAALDRGEIASIETLQKSDPQRLLARQLDTPNKDLQKYGISLRIRGTYIGPDDGGQLITPDINIKTSKQNGDMGMSRGEYETLISGADILELSAIEAKYADKIRAGLLPDLEQALNLIHRYRDNIVEHFIIDTQRSRRVVGFNSAALGFTPDQKFIGEMLMDKVRYQIRTADGTTEMVVNKGRRELELEPLHVPCAYNEYPGCEEHVCQNLGDFEEDYALLHFRDEVQRYANMSGIAIEDADLSKSGRGFMGRENLKQIFNSQNMLGVARDRLITVERAPLLVSAGRNINVPLELKAA